jgi:hypothetical protein
MLHRVPHVLARLAGHGLIAVPRPLFRLDRVDGAPETTLRVADARGDEIVDLAAVARGERASDRIDVHLGPRGPFRIETRVFTCTWPPGFALSHDPYGGAPFLLIGPRDAMIWIAGPLARAKVEPIERLADPSQTIRAVAEATDASRMDLDYEHEGERWWQRRYVIAFGAAPAAEALALSAQARLADEPVACAAIDAIERSLAAYRPD